MKRRMVGRVTGVISERSEARELSVEVVDGSGNSQVRRVLDLVTLTGGAKIGESVLLNTIAVEMQLGTGGLDFVVAVIREEEHEYPPPGHIIKVRYTPVQVPVLAVEAPESPYHEAVHAFRSLEGMPVVCAQLHSQLPAVIAGVRWEWKRSGASGEPSVAYIMTDGAALPYGLSRLAADLKGRGWISCSITAGQAFGGDYEAVNIYSALAMASILEVDAIVVCQGPGNVGTGTRLGFSSIDQGIAINAVASLGGTPIAVPRISFVEDRERHQGVSHHTITVLGKVALVRAIVPIPQMKEAENARVWHELNRSGVAERHTLLSVEADGAFEELIATGLSVKKMGRGIEEERAYFLAGCAAGIASVQVTTENRERQQ